MPNSVTLKTNIPEALAYLLQAAQKTIQNALAEAAQTDSSDSFPQKTLAQITNAHLLTASASSKYGGADLGLIPGTNYALLTILKHIGGGNLVMGRVLEGHLNAQLLIHQFGSEEQQARFARDAFYRQTLWRLEYPGQ